MLRRDALKFLATGTVASALAPEMFAFFQEAHPAGSYALRTLNPHQNATVVLMSEMIIPETDTPGAKGARVNEFIDVILTEWATEEDRNHFLEGLAGVDKQSNDLFGKDFVDAAAAQQWALMRAMDEAIGMEPPRAAAAGPRTKAFFSGSRTVTNLILPGTARIPTPRRPRSWAAPKYPCPTRHGRIRPGMSEAPRP